MNEQDEARDPWADPGYCPDLSRGLPPEIGTAIGEWATRQHGRAAREERQPAIGLTAEEEATARRLAGAVGGSIEVIEVIADIDESEQVEPDAGR